MDITALLDAFSPCDRGNACLRAARFRDGLRMYTDLPLSVRRSGSVIRAMLWDTLFSLILAPGEF